MKIVACCSSAPLRKPVVSAANPTVSTAAMTMQHHGERVEKSLIRSTVIKDMSVVLLRTRAHRGARRCDDIDVRHGNYLLVRVVFVRVTGHLHDGLLQRAALQGQ